MAKYAHKYTVQNVYGCYALTKNSLTPAVNRDLDLLWYTVLKSVPYSYQIVEREVEGEMNLHAANVSQAHQYGAAMAQYSTKQWSLLSARDGEYVLRHSHPSGINEDFLVRDGELHTALMEVDGVWKNVEYLKPMVRKYINGNSSNTTRALGSPLEICQNVAAFLSPEERANSVVPWTYYHILARKLAKQPINLVRDREIREVVHRNLTEGWRKALWELAGFHHAEFPLRLDRFKVGDDGKLYVRQYPGGKETLTPVALRKGLSVLDFVDPLKARL